MMPEERTNECRVDVMAAREDYFDLWARFPVEVEAGRVVEVIVGHEFGALDYLAPEYRWMPMEEFRAFLRVTGAYGRYDEVQVEQDPVDFFRSHVVVGWRGVAHTTASRGWAWESFLGPVRRTEVVA